ncbi:T9SS type B sorting domain-containing protein [Taibaiella lutea]|uniref:T9SS type B sorting domain-containing protein n=1 Tax=Taibaiella lutea TaxID=2608001 RepID=A0A5M6CHM4_9BACT|nr:gliding motility-associated C-terminal domain-containing protein [Taibaiella lutea]KAA5534708.1 T9SS type B sorting domain-containing protein [Taibaiella lutea]
MRFLSFLLLASVGFVLPVQAQLLPVNQPEQDACNALQLCGNTFTTPFSYQGNGLEADLTQTPCGDAFNPCGEDNVVWLKLVVSTAGSIVFTITPVDQQDDYDFAIVNATGINCNNITTANVIRCNFNNNQPVFNNGVLGLNTTSTLTSVPGGTTGSPFLQQITAAAGDVYLIMINNFGAGGGPSSGFTINFAGSTATFNDNTPPHLNSLTSATSCTYKNTVTVHLNTPVACNSITATGSDFQLTPAGTIVSASGVNCNGANGYTENIVLNFAPALAPANYTLKPKLGTDGNTLLNLCGTAVPVTDALTFSVNANAAFATAALNCTTLTLTTNVPVQCGSVAANASDFNITGPGGPVTITNAVGVNCNPAGFSNTINITLANPVTTTGTYTIHAQNGTDGNTLLDDCSTGIPVGNSVTFNAVAKPVLTLPATLTTCINDGVVLPLQITNPSPGVVYTYNWTPATGLNNATIAQPLADPTGDQNYTVTVGSTNTSMCTSTATVAVHSLQGFDITNNNAVVCEGATVQINVTGSDEYTYTWTPTTGVSNPNIKNPVITPPLGSTIYMLTASHPGCTDSSQTITLQAEPNPDGIEIFADKTSVCKYDTVALHAIASPSTFNFTYTWAPAADMLFNGGPNNAYIGNTSGNITVTASTPIGCTASANLFITVFPGDFLQVNTNDTGYCVTGEIQLEASNAVSYKWSPPMGLSATDIANPVASPHTTTNYMVIGKDVHGCRDTQNVVVGVYPAAAVNMPDSVRLYHGETYHLEPNTNCTYFSWFPPAGIDDIHSGDPTFNPEVRTRYFVTASTGHGCSTVDSIDILIEETVIDMPNAFAPGTGGPNGVFKPSKRGVAKLKSFNVYNRWGQKVFESSNIDKGWDGTFNDKPQPMGVYVYTIDIITDSGSAFTRQGNVTLVR